MAGLAQFASTRRGILNRFRAHARRVGTPGDQIFPVVKTIVIRQDPKDASEAA